MEANLFTITYLFFRLSPFIVASFFAIGSIFNNDMKGLIYLVGLIFALGITLIFGNSFKYLLFGSYIPSDSGVCNFLSLGGFSSFSAVPLGLAILCYTFGYLIWSIAKYNLATFNIPTLVIFPILILSDIFWNFSNQCYPITACLISLVVSAGIGVLWAWIVQTRMPEYQYMIIGSNAQMCLQPSSQAFICQETPFTD
jgi:hypothetical protein